MTVVENHRLKVHHVERLCFLIGKCWLTIMNHDGQWSSGKSSPNAVFHATGTADGQRPSQQHPLRWHHAQTVHYWGGRCMGIITILLDCSIASSWRSIAFMANHQLINPLNMISSHHGKPVIDKLLGVVYSCGFGGLPWLPSNTDTSIVGRNWTLDFWGSTGCIWLSPG